MSFKASPILDCSVVLASYSNPRHISECTHNITQVSQSLPKKNVHNPTSEYHTMLSVLNNPDIKFIDERKKWVAEDKERRMPETTGQSLHGETKVIKPICMNNKREKNDTDIDNNDELTNNETTNTDSNTQHVNWIAQLTGRSSHQNSNALTSTDEFKIHDSQNTSGQNTSGQNTSGQNTSGQKTGNQNNTVSQSDKDTVFNSLLPSLHWQDKDEQVMKKSALNRFSREDKIKMYKVMTKLSVDLENAISATTGALDSLSQDEKNNFLFHVIAKGESMYYQSIADPDFCLYMLDQYQPLCDMLSSVSS